MTSSAPLFCELASSGSTPQSETLIPEYTGKRLTIFNNVPTLDGWRGVSVLGVICYHWLSLTLNPASVWCHLASRGRFGVDIFFAISGFLICGRLLQDLQNDGTISLKQFYIKRVFRILPPISVYLGALAILMGIGWTRTQDWEFASTLLFVRNYFPLYHSFALGRYTAQFWSLAVEEHFYLIWPFVLVLLRRRLRTAAMITLCVALSVFIWRTLDAAHGWLMPFGTDVNAKTDTRIDALLWGCLAAFVYPVLQRKVLDSPLYRNLLRVILPLVLLFTIFQNIPGASLYRAALFPALIVSTALAPASLLGRLLSFPIMRWIGRLSYSLYIWQQLFLFPTLAFHSPLRLVQRFPFDMIAILVMAMLSYYLVERPLIRLGHWLADHQVRQPSFRADAAVNVSSPATSFAR